MTVVWVSLSKLNETLLTSPSCQFKMARSLLYREIRFVTVNVGHLGNIAVGIVSITRDVAGGVRDRRQISAGVISDINRRYGPRDPGSRSDPPLESMVRASSALRHLSTWVPVAELKTKVSVLPLRSATADISCHFMHELLSRACP